MKKLISYIFVYFCILLSAQANDKNVLFLTSVGSSFGNARIEVSKTANFNGMKILSTRTVRQGNIWVSVAKVTPKY